MHRTPKQETVLPAKSSLEAQQKAFDTFREIFNFEPCRVSDQGNIRYGMHRVFLSSALRNEVIGLEEISD